MNHKSNMMGCYANPALTCFKENGDCSRCRFILDEPNNNYGGNTMKNMLLIALICILLLPAMAFAADTADISGHWRFCNQGNDGICSGYMYYFKIEKAKNTYTITDECSKNGPTISNIIIDGKRITFDWAYFDQKARYAGNINADHVKAYEMSGYAGDGNANWTWKTVRRMADNPPADNECKQVHALDLLK